MKIRLVLFLVLFCIFSQTVKPENKPRQPIKIQSSGELSNLQVKSLCQDSLGYIWIATARGLNRYDGSRFVHFFKDETNLNSIQDNCVNQLFLNADNQLWIATSGGLSRYDSQSENIYTYNIDDEDPQYYVLSMTEDKNGNLWLGTYRKGILLWDKKTDKVIRPKNALKEQIASSANCVTIDHKDNLWVGFASTFALGKYNIKTEQSVLYNLPDNAFVNSITQIQDSILWLGTNQGFLAFNTVAEKFTNLPDILKNTPQLTYAHIHKVAQLNKDSYIISSSGGAFQYNKQTNSLQRISAIQGTDPQDNEDITCTLEDNQGNLWLGSFNRGISVIKNNVKPFNPDHSLTRILNNKFVSACAEDTTYGNLWFGTRYDGLFCYNPQNGSFKQYTQHNNPAFAAAKSNFIQVLYCDSRGQLWISLGQSVLVARLTKDGMTDLHVLPSIADVVAITEDYEGNMWLGSSTTGLYFCKGGSMNPLLIASQRNMNITKIIPYTDNLLIFASHGANVYTIDNKTFKTQPLIPNTGDYMQLRACINIYRDTSGELWFGSYAHGLLRYDPLNNILTSFSMKDGLPSDDILGMTEDNEGKLWLSTSHGLSRMNLQTSQFYNFNSSDGLQNTQFHEKALLKTADGKIYIGGNFGVDGFNPADIKTNYIRPQVIFEDLKIQNISVYPSEKEWPLKENVAYAKKIKLNHKQTSFSIDYTGFDYYAPDKISYAYRMDGFDDKWIEVGGLKRATYSNLPPGHYKFMLRAKNSDGLWSKTESIDIVIKAAPWLTGWAIAGYIIIISVLSLYFIRLYVSAKYNKISLQLSERQRMHEHEITKQKINFYNNVSHELRTPLTLISGNLDLFTRNRNFAPEERKYLSMTIFNVNRLLKLVNQLLDFSKMEYDTLALKVTRTDVAPLIRDIANTFRFSAQNKEINYTLHIEEERMIIYIDEDKLEKILTNLISNAIKYTPYKGDIAIHISRTNGTLVAKDYNQNYVPQFSYLEFKVTNSGNKIPQDKLDHMFDRYTRLDESDHKEEQAGTGIGLHYTKSLVSTHKGYIKAASEENRILFSFVIPTEKSAYDKTEITEVPPVQNEHLRSMDRVNILNLNAPIPERKGSKDYTLLIIEDDPQIHNLLHDILHKSYDLLHAYNGVEGLGIIRDKMPDLVISDVRMPEMDGFELCKIVKNDPQLSHIMVVLLTAKTRVEEYVEGYAKGADAYLTKPFNIDHLISVVNGLIQNRNRLRAHLGLAQPVEKGKNESENASGNTKSTAKTKIVLSELDQRFLDKLHSFIDVNIENPDININVIAVELGFSRTSFYRKLKSLTGLAPNDYVRNFKMKKAAQLIVEGNLSIAEISDQTGFGTQSHFSTAFKKYYGVSPKDFKESQIE